MRTTIPELGVFSLSCGDNRVPGVVAAGRQEPRSVWTREHLTRSDPRSNGNFGLADIARGGNWLSFELLGHGAPVVVRLTGLAGSSRVVGARNRGTGYGTVLTLLVRTSKDLQGRPPLVSRCIYFMGLFFHGGNTGSNPVGDANLTAFRRSPDIH